QTKNILDASVDGYFTRWPQNATTFLNRTKNHLPSMIMYPYGKGWVVATTIYADWGFTYDQSTNDETILVRDLLAWARQPEKTIPELKPGETINIPVNIINATTTISADKIILKILDPDKEIITTQEIMKSVPPMSSVIATFTYTVAPSKLGIYWINYTLIKTDGSMVQSEIEGEKFAISQQLGVREVEQELSCSVTGPGEMLVGGEETVFTIYLQNRGNTDRYVTVSWDITHSPITQLGTFLVPAHGGTSTS
ncbi:MAG: hypothetical protein AAB267_10330, partial [Candidatus Desantisbacteria bacterium]